MNLIIDVMEREILIQEEYLDNPWKIMVCCILLNQTNNKQVRPILDAVFELIPDYQSAISCPRESLVAVIKTTGFYNIKAGRIKRMSKEWPDFCNKKNGMKVTDLSGIGIYAKESWDIFVDNDLTITPTDKKLRAYLESTGNSSIEINK